MVRLDPQTAQAVAHQLQGNPALIVLFAAAVVALAAVAAFGCAKGAKKKPREKSSVQYYGGTGYTAAPTTYKAPSAGKSATKASSGLATGLAAGAVTVDTAIYSGAACGGGGHGGGCGGGCGGGGCGGGGCGGC